ncbi:helicase HerA domain-containing protein, partial [uncultured Sphingomonas sp.]|uniref:helicase HerA domain-containing protein n=1 Tax=uncultured Sphingomonas sp. TaxID=158754 RepID=UPI0035C9B948
MNDMSGSHAFDTATALSLGTPEPNSGAAIGCVVSIAGSSSRVLFDRVSLGRIAQHADPVVGAAGQVGGQIKMRVGSAWLVANIRSLALENIDGEWVAADIDFLGEGDEERLTGKLYHFRRGVTRYPIPGCEVFPVTTADLKQIYSAEDRPHIAVGTVYPTRDVRAALYVDAMLGKHFALVGSTGTGKS